jgi:hypothetical protein
VEKQVAIIWAATNGLLDDVETTRIAEFEAGLYRHLESGYPELLPAIANEKTLSDELTAQLEKAVGEFKNQGGYGETDDAASAPAASDAPSADGAGTSAAAGASDEKPDDASTTGEVEPPDATLPERDAEVGEAAVKDVATTDDEASPKAEG